MRNVSVVAVLVLACGYVSSDIFYSVSAQEFGIILRNGRLVGTAMPGPGWKLPFVDSVVSISMQENITKWDSFQARTKDLDVINIDVSVNWQIKSVDAIDFYKKYGELEGVDNAILVPRITEGLRVAISHLSTMDALNKRKLISAIKNHMDRTSFSPVTINRVFVGSTHAESIHYSD